MPKPSFWNEEPQIRISLQTKTPMEPKPENVQVWVELPLSDLRKDHVQILGDQLAVNNMQNTFYTRGWCSHDAFKAAQLMKEAIESQEHLENTVAASSHLKSQRGGSGKGLLKLHRGTSLADENDEITVPVSIEPNSYDSSNVSHDYDGQDGNIRDLGLKFIFPINNPELVSRCPDLTGLTHMEEPNVLFSLYHRYENDHIYTNVASILLAVNPYQELSIYDNQTMMTYRSKSATGKTQGTSPHVFSVAEEAYSNLTSPFSKKRKKNPKNQTLIVCGESGSGKTESAKHLMRYLANRTYDLSKSVHDASQQSQVERQVLEANVILEAIGNANTLLNHNSSRFGKFTKLFINTDATNECGVCEIGKVLGAATETYLLEKSRVVRQNPGERNFHLFYICLAGLKSEHRELFELVDFGPEDFYYTNQGGIFEVPGIDDAKWYNNLVKALSIVHVDEELQTQLFGIVAALLHMGNIEFIADGTSDDGSVITEQSKFHALSAAKLFGVNVEDLVRRLTTTNVKVVKETIAKKLNPRDASVNRDSIAKALYDDMFSWVVDQINAALNGPGDFSWIGILDVFGFESFENNSFEQFCINFANERLQQHFNFSILLSEQREYALEGILWDPLQIPDAEDTIQLITSKQGVLDLLDSTCKLKSVGPDSFVKDLFEVHRGHPRLYQIPRSGGPKHFKREMGFGIEHYAGTVYYNAEEFLAKNTDSTDPDTAKLFRASSHFVVAEVVTPLSERTRIDYPEISGSPPRKTGKGINVAINITGSKQKLRSKFASVSNTFSKQLKVLMETLAATNSYFIRCIKPNTLKKPSIFDPVYVRPQLKCGGLVEAVKMLKKGFPTRVSFQEIYNQYSPLLYPQPTFELNRRDFSQAVLALFDLQRSEYQLGLTKVFFKAGRRALLENVMNRDSKLSPEDMDILMNFLMKKRWQRALATIKATVVFQKCIKRIRAIHRLFKATQVIKVIQKSIFSLLHRVRRRRLQDSSFTVQAGLRVVVVSLRSSKKIAQVKLERERIEKLARQAALEEEEKVRVTQLKREERRVELERMEEDQRLKREQQELEKKQQLENDIEAELQRRLQEDRERQEKESKVLSERQVSAMISMMQQMGISVSPEAAASLQEGQVPEILNAQLRGISMPPPEQEIRRWIEEFLCCSLDEDLLASLSDGTVLLKIVNTIKPSMQVAIHDQISELSIRDHFERFNRLAGLLGVPSHLIFGSEALKDPKSMPRILSCLGVLKHVAFEMGLQKVGDAMKRNKDNDSSVDLYLRIEDLEKQVESLSGRLKDTLTENKRLQDAVVRLDEINRKMVVDLMKELSARSHESQRKRSSVDSKTDVRIHEETRRISETARNTKSIARDSRYTMFEINNEGSGPPKTYLNTNAASRAKTNSRDCIVM